ncbi:MAG: hypothetical protein M0O96_10610 [Desulforhopalus sp.]|nr:hypothetical protein [Desulforhopalus sp.]
MTTWRVLFRGLSVMVAISLIAATVETRHALSTEQHRGKPPPYRFFTNGDGRVLWSVKNVIDISARSRPATREQGTVRTEGTDHVVQDGEGTAFLTSA